MDIHASYEQERHGWLKWFADESVTPLRLIYEDFEKDANAALRVLVSELGLKLRSNVSPRVGLKKLADELSAIWTQRLQMRLFNMS